MDIRETRQVNDTRAKVVLELPWPPSMNNYWRHVGHKTMLSAAGRIYRHAVAGAVLEQRAARHFAGRLSVIVQAYPPDRRRRDLDNMLKAVLDALEAAGVYEDDSQIDELLIRRMGVVPNGGITVYIWEEATNGEAE